MKSKIERPIVNNSNQEELSKAAEVFEIPELVSCIIKNGFFADKELSALSLTSRALFSVANPELNKRAAEILVTHVILGEQDKAQAMIEKNPELLKIRTKAIDYSGRTIVGTAFQAACGAGDKPMWEMMLPFFQSLEQGEALRQFHEQFPKGIEDDVSAVQLKDYYNALAFAIITDEDHGLSAIEGFRKEISSQKEITQGKHFNLQHLIAAYQTYIDNFDALVNSDNRDLFWKKVIGYVQRQVTAFDAQLHCSGIKCVLDGKSTFSRSFEFQNDGSFFPLTINSGLGFDFGCWAVDRGLVAICVRGLPRGRVTGEALLKNYVEQKQMRLQDLESHLSKECIISPINCS